LARDSLSPLQLRFASAAVLGPLSLAALWLGGAWLLALMLLAGGAMGWEWARLAGRGRFGIVGALVAVTAIAPLGLVGLGGGLGAASLLAVAGAVLVFAGAAAAGQSEPAWAAGGTLWLAAGAVAFFALARLPEIGFETAFWLLLIVWANDSAAYASGRAIGGPKLAPRLSPNKTWAGFAGGVASAALIGGLAGALSGTPHPLALAALSLALGVAAQLGDLAESSAKRHFGVKDSSRLIPGHGGLLDRVDGLLAASLVAGAVTLGTGRSPLLW
jgi:phosphatidate cytidylyltransferase